MAPPLKSPIYLLAHGIEVVGENHAARYVMLRLRPHSFFPNATPRGHHIEVQRSRVVMSAHLGRALERNEHVHHGPKGRHDDSLSNLKIISAADHNRHHKTGSKHRPESKEKTTQTLLRLYREGVMVAKPRFGEENHAAKLTAAQVRKIRRSKQSGPNLGRLYGVTRQSINAIKRGETWRTA